MGDAREGRPGVPLFSFSSQIARSLMLSMISRLAVLLAVAAAGHPARAQDPVALSFGSGDYAELAPDALALTGDLTIEAWIRIDQHTAGRSFAQIVQREGAGSGAAANAHYTLALTSNGRLDAYHQSGAGIAAVALSTSAVPLGRWVHVAEVRDAAARTYRFYIDGVPEAPVSYTANPDGGSGTVTRFGSPAYPFVGRLDEVRIWGRALTAEEILAHKDAEIEPPAPDGLVGYWRFDDGPATTTADLSGNDHTATLHGATWATDGPPFEGTGETGDAQDDYAITGRDQPVTVDVLANDEGAVRLASVSAASSGTAEIESDAVVYTPAPGFVGVDRVDYTAEDASGADRSASLTISVAGSGAARIIADGRFEDWEGIDPVALDPDDQPAGAVDLRALALTNDERTLRLRLTFADETTIQQDNDLVLYLDTDADASTGRAVPGMGADLVFAFGARSGTFIHDGRSTTVEHEDLGLVWAPTYASAEYEVEVDLDAEVGGRRVFPGDTLLVALATASGERLPQSEAGAAYILDRTTELRAYDGPSLDRAPGAVRMLSYNVLFDSVFEGAPKASFTRILQALRPDVIAFQEIYDHSGTQAAALVAEALGDGPWYSGDAGSDNLLVSRWPVTLERDLGGNSAFVVETPGELRRDLLVISAHTPCCDNEAGRLVETDRFMQFVRQVGEGSVAGIDPETPVVIVGDMNMVGTDRPLRTMRTGDLVDNTTFGPDFAPDLDGTDLGDALPLHLGSPSSFTWYDEGSDFPAGRLDYVVYTDSALELDNAFVLFTPDLSGEALTAAGLLATDTNTTSDHLPVVADFTPVRSTGAASRAPDGFAVHAPTPNPFAGSTAFRIDMPRASDVRVEVFDVLGRRLAVPFEARLAAGVHQIPFDGAALAPGVYLYRVTTGDGVAGGRMVRR